MKFCALNTTKARRLAISQKVLGLPVIAVYEERRHDRLLREGRCYARERGGHDQGVHLIEMCSGGAIPLFQTVASQIGFL